MHITCNKCNTIFKFPSDQVPKFTSGKKVQCSKCKNIWIITPKEFNDVEVQQNIDTSTKSTNSVPDTESDNINTSTGGLHNHVQQKNAVTISTLTLVLPFVLVALAILLFTATIKYNIAVQGLIFPDKKYLLISEVNTSYIPSTKTRVITYKLSNKSDVNIRMPNIKVKTYSQNHELIHNHVFSNKDIMLAPRANTILTTKFTDEHNNLSLFNINIGNDLLFYLDDLACKCNFIT